MERLYELELQVEKIINILNNVIKFIQMNNLIEERENAFNIIKDNYQTLTTQDVDLLNFNFKKLARSVATIIHPDRFPQDEELGAKANEILQSFNGSIDSLNIQVKDALTHGQTTYLWHLNKTNKAEQEYQRAYDQEKKQYQEEYGPRRRRSNRTENQSQRNTHEGNYRGQNYYNYKSRADKTQSQGSRYYSEEAESYNEDSWIKTQAKKASEYVKSRINFKINKIPSTEKDYVTLKALYERKIRSIQYEINATKNKIQSLNNKHYQIIFERDRFCSQSNIEAEYERELEEITVNKQRVSDELNLLHFNINRRISELTPLINEQYRAYQSYYAQMCNLYNREKEMVSRGMTRLLNIPKGMSLDNYFNKYHQIFNNPPQMKIVSIKNDILKSDPTYCHLEERIEILNNKYKELRNKINDYIQNANEIKSDKYKKYQQKYVALEKQVIDEIESKKKTLSGLESNLSYSNWQYVNFQTEYGHLANSEGAKRR